MWGSVQGGSDSGHQETRTQAGKTHCVVRTCQSTRAGEESGAGIRVEMGLGYMSRGGRCGLGCGKVLDSLGAQPGTGTELRFEQWAMVSPRPCPQLDPHLQALPRSGQSEPGTDGSPATNKWALPGRGEGRLALLPFQPSTRPNTKIPTETPGPRRRQQKGPFISELN